MVSATLRGAAAHAISVAASAKREMTSSVFCVGVSSFSDLDRASASAGLIQSCSTISVPSKRAVCPVGAAAMKNRVS